MLTTHQGIVKVLKSFVAAGIAGLAVNSADSSFGNPSQEERPVYLVLKEETSAREYFKALERLRRNNPYD